MASPLNRPHMPPWGHWQSFPWSGHSTISVSFTRDDLSQRHQAVPQHLSRNNPCSIDRTYREPVTRAKPYVPALVVFLSAFSVHRDIALTLVPTLSLSPHL